MQFSMRTRVSTDAVRETIVNRPDCYLRPQHPEATFDIGQRFVVQDDLFGLKRRRVGGQQQFTVRAFGQLPCPFVDLVGKGLAFAIDPNDLCQVDFDYGMIDSSADIHVEELPPADMLTAVMPNALVLYEPKFGRGQYSRSRSASSAAADL